MSPESSAHRTRKRSQRQGFAIPKEGPRFQTDMREFEGLDVLNQLRQSFLVKIDKHSGLVNKNALMPRAIINALNMDPLDRYDQGIHVVAIGDLNERKRVHSDFPEWSIFSVYAVFPFNERTSRFVASNSSLLQNELSEGASIDQVVNYQADRIQEETLFEKQRRLILEIKRIDTAITRRITGSPDIGTQTSDELITWKNKKLLDYLVISDDLQEQYSDLATDLYSIDSVSTRHVKIVMRHFEDLSIIKRLIDARVNSSLVFSKREHSTGISIASLLKDYRIFIEDPGSASDAIKVSVGICKILGLSLKELSDESVSEQVIIDMVDGDSEKLGAETIIFTPSQEFEEQPRSALTRKQLKRDKKRQPKARDLLQSTKYDNP